MNNSTTLDQRSIELRKVIVETMIAGNRGHLASALSLVEMIRVLYDDILKYDSNAPKWEKRDRFILSKGHGCLALYAILAEKGFFPKKELWKFCRQDGILGGHPEYGKTPGVEASTGSLGHGLSIGIGFALNARFENADHRIFVIVGDGESNEGSIWEGALCAGKHKLDNLTVLIDYNKQQSYDTVENVSKLEPFADKWGNFGFAVSEVDGHDVEQLRAALYAVPLQKGKPSAIICHTIKGKGISFVEKNLAWHHKSNLKDEEIQSLREDLERNL